MRSFSLILFIQFPSSDASLWSGHLGTEQVKLRRVTRVGVRLKIRSSVAVLELLGAKTVFQRSGPLRHGSWVKEGGLQRSFWKLNPSRLLIWRKVLRHLVTL